MKPSRALDLKRRDVLAAAARFGASNPRVFGSVLDGADHEGSDIDLLVDAAPDTTLFDLGALQIELAELLGVNVDLVTPADLPEGLRARVLAEAEPL